jgi:hypothetical protein
MKAVRVLNGQASGGRRRLGVARRRGGVTGTISSTPDVMGRTSHGPTTDGQLPSTVLAVTDALLWAAHGGMLAGAAVGHARLAVHGKA